MRSHVETGDEGATEQMMVFVQQLVGAGCTIATGSRPRLAAETEPASEMKVGQRAHHQPQAAHHEDGFLQPASPGEQRDRSHSDGDLQRRGGLGPAVMLVQLGFAHLVDFGRLLFELFGGQLDLGLLSSVAFGLGLEERSACEYSGQT